MDNSHVLTLVASDNPLSDGVLGSVFMTLFEHGFEHGIVEANAKKVWLCQGKALDIILPEALPLNMFDAVKKVVSHARVDCFLSPQVGRRKKLLISDMDSTIVDGEVLDDMADHLGLGDMVSAITQQAMDGSLDFETSLRKRVALLAGRSSEAIQATLKQTKLHQGAQVLVETMRRHGAMCVLISGGFTFFTDHVAQICGFHHHHGNILQVKDGVMTGFLEDPILDRDAKLSYMKEYMAQKRLKARDVLAIGDGANDKAIIETAGLGIGYYPKPVIADTTHNVVEYGDLTTALYAQGYHEQEFRRPVLR